MEHTIRSRVYDEFYIRKGLILKVYKFEISEETKDITIPYNGWLLENTRSINKSDYIPEGIYEVIKNKIVIVKTKEGFKKLKLKKGTFIYGNKIIEKTNTSNYVYVVDNFNGLRGNVEKVFNDLNNLQHRISESFR